MAGSSPSLPDGSNPSAAIVQSASDVQCSRLLKTTHLVARNESGHLLRKWSSDEAMGQGLALLLNQASGLSRLLLWPLLDAQEE